MVLHTYVLRVQYSYGVVLVFWFWWEIVFGVTCLLSVQYSCAVVSVFWLWQEIVLKMRTPSIEDVIKLSSVVCRLSSVVQMYLGRNSLHTDDTDTLSVLVSSVCKEFLPKYIGH